ncbi:hypothetical protein GUITHDRAFT_121186 [Guillardia theta CCMP2712]|uniref:Uncharacterized protein n=1 Tax=Guillardia theta (strain CCMP2712) TaxID=905079 RepID=L1I9V1_GUITC|nr:hypothetical protein GUITHDRAFT_121186 [Guillardia theta CCMP2712]EKX32630.1 hypothetical protein GUITHDRAFT_121186 [Guillardia theta CCMP2712]|eukprot:XP_005819610.1 hypothetical protein GUITHDRAFT_121186 [Guillardia theta CCMP2712]
MLNPVRASLFLLSLASLVSCDLLSEQKPSFAWPQLKNSEPKWPQNPSPSAVYKHVETSARAGAEGGEKAAKKTLLEEVSKSTPKASKAPEGSSNAPGVVEKKLAAVQSTIQHVLSDVEHLSNEVKKEEAKKEDVKTASTKPAAKSQSSTKLRVKVAEVVKKAVSATKQVHSKIPIARVLSKNQVLVKIPKQRQAGGLFAFEVPGRGMFVTHTTPGSSKAKWLKVDLNDKEAEARSAVPKKAALKQHALETLVASKSLTGSKPALEWFRVVIPNNVQNGIFQTMVQGHGPILVKVPHGMVPGQTVVMKLPVRAVSAPSRSAKMSVKSPAKAEELQSNSSSQQDEIDWNQKGPEKKGFFDAFEAPRPTPESSHPAAEADAGQKKVDYAWPKPGYLFPGMDKDSSKKKIVWPGQEPSKEVEWPDHIGEPPAPLLETPSKKLQPDWFKPFASPAQGSRESPTNKKEEFSFAFSNPLASEPGPAEQQHEARGESRPAGRSEGAAGAESNGLLIPVVINWSMITAGTAMEFEIQQV